MKNGPEEFRKRLEGELRAAGKELAGREMPRLTEELFVLYEKNGDRKKYEDVYFLRRKYLSAFGILALEYQREEDIRKLETILWEICGEECWALPAHVDRKENPAWRITVDLFASETAQALAELRVRLGNRLSKKLQERISREIFDRVLTPFMDSEPPYDWWEGCDMNWCAVCCGAIGSAAMNLMEHGSEKLEALLERLQAALPHYLEGFTGDGVCLEGIGYFSYGMSFYTAFADQLREYTGGRIDLMKGEKLRKIAEFQNACYFRSGRTVSFSDGSSRERFRAGLTARLAMEAPEMEIPDYALAAGLEDDACFRYLMLSRDMDYTKQYLNQAKIKEKRTGQRHTVFPEAQWSVCESENGCGMAVKGGHNGEPHNHNDIGSFLYLGGSELFLDDLGAGKYTKAYMHEGRYEILCNRSLGHNVPLINGREQKEGKEYRCRSFETDGRGTTELEIGGAYGLGEASEIKRTLHFDLQNGNLSVRDEFHASEIYEIKENLVSRLKPEIRGKCFYIKGKEHTCRVDCKEGKNLTIIPKEHYEHDGSLVTVYLMQWEPAEACERNMEFHVEFI